MINTTALKLTAAIGSNDPTFNYVDWCVQQTIYFQSSVNQAMLIFIGISWVLMILSSYTYRFPRWNKYHESLLHLSRLSLVMVVASWFLFTYLGIVWFE